MRLRRAVLSVVTLTILLPASTWCQNHSPSSLQTQDVRKFGAVCNWNGSTGSDDTQAFQKAADAAHSLYAHNGGRPVRIMVPANCVVGGMVNAGSGVQFFGPGSIFVPNQTTMPGKPGTSHHPTLVFTNADDVAVEQLTINVVIPCPGDDAICGAVYWQSSQDDAVAHKHAHFDRNVINNADWGIYVSYARGSGSLTDVVMTNNSVSSPPGKYSNGDGLHVDGTVTNTRIIGNHINFRGDACIALTSEVGHVLSGGVIDNNVCTQDRVGIDISGVSNVTVMGNHVQASLPAPGLSNPAFREIFYSGTPTLDGCCYPSNVQVRDNYFENPESADGATVKIDPLNFAGQTKWPNLMSSFVHNTIGGSSGSIYARGSGITINSNTLLISGARIIVDYDGKNSLPTTNVQIGKNYWHGDGEVYLGGNRSLYSNVVMSPQETTGKFKGTNLQNLKSTNSAIR